MSTEPPRFAPPEPEPETPKGEESALSTQAWAPPQPPIDSPWASRTASPTHPTPRSAGKRWALGLGISAAVLGVIGVIVGASVALGALIVELTEDGGLAETLSPESPELLEGEPGAPEPLEPTDCAEDCFGPFHLDDAAVDDAIFATLGTPELFEPQGTYGASSAALEHEYLAEAWVDQEAGPDECFFSYANSPLAYSVTEAPPEGDSIYFLASYQSANEFSTSYRSIRFFETASDAHDHMSALHAVIPTCTRYSLGTGIDTWKASVSPMPALDLPSTVAAVGWVERGAYSGRFYGVDLVRGNAVVRATVYTDGAIKESDFRAYAQALAWNLASWTPQN